MMLSGWGNFPRAASELLTPQVPHDVPGLLDHASLIARGAGRAYGDAAIGAQATISMLRLDRFLELDAARAELTVEAGAMLSDVIECLLPRGYFPPVVPGTRYVTVGGMVAANVHGKNHHLAGGFGRHVRSLKLVTADGSVITCSRRNNPEVFHATIGGMGLTGIITEVTFGLRRVESGYIRQETLVAPNLSSAMEILESSSGWSYTVGWIDGLSGGSGLGRSLIFRGEHATQQDLQRAGLPDVIPPARTGLTIPFDFPDAALNRLSVRAFNTLYYANGKRQRGERLVGWAPYFFPLDSIFHWNRIYGRRGFIQHQAVVPKASSPQALREMLHCINQEGNPSFLAVLKLLGPDDDGLLSFPMEGYTLAIDFPVNEKSLALAEKLDCIVSDHGGRLYLAKDARQSRALVDGGYPNLAEFRALRRRLQADTKFRSLLSERLGL